MGAVCFNSLLKVGRGGKIRTCDLSVPNRALYQAEPRPEFSCFIEETTNKWRILQVLNAKSKLR